jgi:molybdate transport system substrate-binding protein
VRRALPLLTLSLVGSLGACGSDGSSTEGGTTLTVFAASSLRDPFTDLGEQFEDDHDGVEVTFSFAGSTDLAAQIEQGADADVFASADEATMDRLTGTDPLVGEPQLFATNTLQIAVPPGNPAEVRSLQDLTQQDVRLVLCAPAVPCGAAATELEDLTGTDLSPSSEEQSVTDVLGKVTSGEADAGLVYVTDVRAAGDRVEGIELPEAEDVVNYYPVATVSDSTHADLAEQFLRLVVGDEGQQVLADAGFGKP